MAKKKKKIPVFLILGGLGFAGYMLTRDKDSLEKKYRQLYKNYTIDDVTKSQTATAQNISEQFDDIPPAVLENANYLAKHILNPLVKEFGKDSVDLDSWYRHPILNTAVGGVDGSFHILGGTVDLDLFQGGFVQNDVFLDWLVNNNIPFTELALEYGTISNPDSIHIAYMEGRDERQVIRIAPGEHDVHPYSWLTARFGK